MNTTASPGEPASDTAPRRIPIVSRRFAALLCLGLGAQVVAAQAACPPGTSTKFALQVLKQVGWKVADEGPRQALAIALLDCLASPDPELRDGIAFDALSTWARGRALTPATLETIRATLAPRLAPDAADEAGFAQPFTALVLAEVARADRVQPYLSDAARGELVRVATAYLASVRDYRGFDAVDGWRHGVAHGADLLLQLSLNLALDRAQLDAILAAVASQVMPAGGHFYIYGEGERLMAPVFYIGRRGALSSAEWSDWFARLVARRPSAARPTQASLAANHDLAAFLLPLYASIRESGTPEMQAQMLPGVAAALKSLD
jgi:hypothetical protein